jgi:hypothetical protein
MEDPPDDLTEPEPTNALLINAAKGSHPNPLPHWDIRQVLSKNSRPSANLTQIEYKASNHKASSGQSLSLIDRGANGGIVGTDVHTIFNTDKLWVSEVLTTINAPILIFVQLMEWYKLRKDPL